ncbi:MAG TPA: TIGR03435 family protein [Bryobacteraceae bacterium]|nr:TIGR03435 family protein [Bryobacteraceae bacterium]
MKASRVQRLLLSIVALSTLPGSALLAQNITGSWQGALKVNGPSGSVDLRIVMKISRADDESLKGIFYSIDQGGAPVNATSVTLRGRTVKISIAQLNGTFEGNLSGDDNIRGTWSQGGPALPLNLVRATDQTAWEIPPPPPQPVLMPATAKPEFTVATIKPSNPTAQGKGYGFRGREVITVNTPVNWLITLAYSLHAHQIVGGAGWLDSEKYDVTGLPDTPGQPSRDQLKLMIQKLLADRFQLKFHMEKKELKAYTITVLKTGAKIAVSTADPNSLPGVGFGGAPGGAMTLNVRNAILDSVANALQGNLLDQPVINRTGLTGKYDFTLRFTPDAAQLAALGPLPPAGAPDPDAPPDIFAAFQQQLGLKLESTRTTVDVMVIDKIEKPSEN